MYPLTIIFVSVAYTHVEVAREALQKNIELLIEIATHECYDSNITVNRCCKNIVVRDHEYLRTGKCMIIIYSVDNTIMICLHTTHIFRWCSKTFSYEG